MASLARRLAGFATCALVLVFAASGAQAIPVDASHGVRFYQQDFVTLTTTLRRIDSGVFEVDMIRLRKKSGLASGYLNVVTPKGWVVRNLPVPAEDAYPYGKLSTDFDLGVLHGTEVNSLNAVVDYSADGSANFSGTAMLPFVVTPITVSLGGADGDSPSGPPTPPNHSSYAFPGGAPVTDLVFQKDHPNVEAAKNQCFPASVANSLQYLKNRYGLPVTHEHKPGIRPSASPGDTSLVGQIDEAMNRSVTSRRVGRGVGAGGLKGKLNYIAKNKLNTRLQVKHWGSWNGDNGASAMSSDTIDGVTANSTAGGADISMDTVFQALNEGQNCEMVYSWQGVDANGRAVGGAHAVDVLGGARIHGRRSIIFASDRNQDSDTEGAGQAGIEHVFIDGPDANKLHSLGGGSNRKLRLVICEKYVFPPLTLRTIETIDPKGHKCCVTPPPPSADVVVDKGSMTVSAKNAAAWLPLKGSISNGNFELTSMATVAGFANVQTRFTGTYANGLYDGTITVGAKGELYGVPISYRVRLTEPQRSAILPAMRLNGMRQALAVKAGDMVKPAIGMNAGPFTGTPGDWFVVLGTADGRFLHLDLATMSWMDGVRPSYTGPLFDLPYFGLPELENLPPGTHSFYFGFDNKPNGQLDFDAVVYERTDLTVAP